MGNYDIFISIHIDNLLIIVSSQESIDHLILSLKISLEVDRKVTPMNIRRNRMPI
jgi:hypothetical protein